MSGRACLAGKTINEPGDMLTNADVVGDLLTRGGRWMARKSDLGRVSTVQNGTKQNFPTGRFLFVNTFICLNSKDNGHSKFIYYLAFQNQPFGGILLCFEQQASTAKEGFLKIPVLLRNDARHWCTSCDISSLVGISDNIFMAKQD